MTKTKKEILFHYRRFTHFLHITKKDTLSDLRLLIDEKISSYMKPKGDWIFSVDDVQVGKKQEEEKMLWKDIIKRKGRVELIEQKICSLKRKSPPKEEEVKEDPDPSDCEPVEDPGQGSGSGRKKTKRTSTVAVTPDMAPSSRGAVSPEHTNSGAHELPEILPSNQNVVAGTEDSVTPDVAPSSRGAVSPEHTNSGAHELPEILPSNQNVVAGIEDSVTPDRAPSSSRGAVSPQQSTNSGAQELPEIQPSNRNVALRTEGASNDQPEAVAVPSSAPSRVVPIKEETRKKFAEERKKSFAQYGDRYLLHSQHPKGMMRLGGNTRMTFVVPRENHPALEASDYPKPLHLLGRDGDIHREDFGYMAFNGAWQPNGPMYAGQETAAVRSVPKHFKKTRDPFPIFMKRTLTTKQDEKEGSLLGWEYVGNYSYVPFDPDDETAVFYESANNISQASRNEIARKIFESYQKDRGRETKSIEEWRARLIEAIAQEQPHAPHSLAARCLELGFTPNMSGEKLCNLIVKLDEYHGQDLIKFEYYDERIYNYCLGGKTSCTKDGATIRSGAVGGPAKAQDWYDFATVNMLFKY